MVAIGPYTLGALNANQELPASEAPMEYLLQVIGGGTLTVEFQDTLDGGTTWSPVGIINALTQAVVANITANGLYRVGGAGAAGLVLRRPRIIATAYTSGNFNIRLVSALRG